MDAQPVVVLLATGVGPVVPDAAVFAAALRSVLASDLPRVVVASAALAQTAARVVGAQDVVAMAEVDPKGSGGAGVAMATGVMARPHAPGWVFLPAGMAAVRPGTLRAVAAALAEHPIVYAQCRGQRGQPVAFSGEMYSELIALRGDDAARRLLARFAAQAVEVDDAAVAIEPAGFSMWSAAGVPALPPAPAARWSAGPGSAS
jgi:molybdenum cofactor cytidylyltransferase